MKTMSSVVDHRSRSFTKYALHVAISITASALVCTQSVFAQTHGGFTPGMSLGQYGSPIASDPVDPWNAVPPLLADPALAAAPKEPVEPPSPGMPLQFVPGLPGGFIEPWNDPAIPVTRPMVMSPLNSMDMDRPGGGVYSPVR
jgi:hypothetical protein